MEDISIKLEPVVMVVEETALVVQDYPLSYMYLQSGSSVKTELGTQSGTNSESLGVIDVTTMKKEEPTDGLGGHGYATKDDKRFNEDNSDRYQDTEKVRGDEAGNILNMAMERPFPVTLFRVDMELKNNTGINNELLETDNLGPSTGQFQSERENITESREQSTKQPLLLQPRMCERAADKLYRYPLCSYSCKGGKNLKNHEITHTREKPYKCSLCPYSCATKGHLKSDEMCHTGIKLYRCSLCPYSCVMSSHLKMHERIHGDEPHRCHLCPYSCATKQQLKCHKRIHTGDKPRKCSLCPYSSTLKEEMMIHERSHTSVKPYQCLMCQYACSHKGSLKSHERTHTGEKPYRCSMCPFSCAKNSGLKRHERRHTGVKPYKCLS